MRLPNIFYTANLICFCMLLAACGSFTGEKPVKKDTPSNAALDKTKKTIVGDPQLAPSELQSASGEKSKSVSSASNQVETFGRYLVKSGYVEMETNQDIGTDYHSVSRVKKTFDNYGRDELMEITNDININGDKKTESQKMLMRGGWMHELRKDFIAARQHPYTQFDLMNMEFSLLDAEAMHLYNIKNLGMVIKDNRSCNHYFIDFHSKEQNMKGDMYTYKNLFYGMDVSMGDANIHCRITRFDENIQVDQKKFDIPAGYRIIDADNSDN